MTIDTFLKELPGSTVPFSARDLFNLKAGIELSHNQKVKIAFVVQRCGENIFGGAERYILELARACAMRGARVEIFTSRSTNYLQWNNSLDPEENLQIDHTVTLRIRRFSIYFSRRRIAFAVTRRLYYVLNRFRRIFLLHTLLRESFLLFQGPWCPALWKTLCAEQEQFDLVVCGGYLYAPSAKAIKILSESKKAVLIPMAHNEPEFHLSFAGDLIKNAEYLGFLSEAEKRLVEFIWPESAHKKSIFVHPGLNEGRTMEDGLKLSVPLPNRFLLYVGRIDPHKGINFLLQNIPQNIPIIFAGDINMPVKNTPTRIFLGKVSDDARDHLIQQSAALVIASQFESYSMVTADALAAGKLVLALKGCGPIDELITNYGGISSEAENFSTWAQKIYDGSPLPENTSPQQTKIRSERSWDTAATRLLALAYESHSNSHV